MPPTKHESIFGYNVSRQYPFKWVTPVTIVGGVVVFALVTILSIATQGYETITVFSSQPNLTMTDPTLFTNWPAFLTSNTNSECSATTFPVGSKVYTNNTALPYTITDINQLNDGGDRSQLLTGALPYQNNVLQNCTVGRIQAEFQNIERTATQIARQQWGVALTAYLSCIIDTDNGLISISLTTSYDLNPSDNSPQSFPFTFPGRNETTEASLWWGESLLAWYYVASTQSMHLANDAFAASGELPPVYKGSATFFLSGDNSTETVNPESLDFFNAGCFFIPFNSTGIEDAVYYCHAEGMGNSERIGSLAAANVSDPNAPLPGIWIPTDSLAKIFYFTLMADLGRNDLGGGSLLTDPRLLTFFSANITRIAEQSPPWGENINVTLIDGLSHQPFSMDNATAASLLGVAPSVMAAEYLCQVPRLKSTGTLLVSVLVNNLVLLSTIWAIYKFLIDYFLMRKYPHMNTCEGCEARAERYSVGEGNQRMNGDEEASRKLLPTSTELQVLHCNPETT